MIIFKDILNGCELATDASNPKLVDDLIYEFDAKLVNRTTNVDDINIGGNKSAEDAGEEEADGTITESGYNVALDNQLEKYDISDKKLYTAELKKYMKRLEAKLQEENPDRVPIFKEKMAVFAKNLLKNFKNLEFYVHSEAIAKSEDGFPGMLVILEFGEKPDGSESYTFKFFKDGLVEEKC